MLEDEREWIGRFGAHLLQERRMSTHTRLAYERDLESLAGFAARRGIRRWAELDHALLRTFAAASHGAGQSRPVNSGKLFVACSRSIAVRQRSR